MQHKTIQQKLREIGIDPESLILGDFDVIGEFTAKRHREAHDPRYKTTGCFYRSNYERGILIYNLIVTGNLDSYLEVGFGRGFSFLCAAKAFATLGKKGRIVTVDPALSKELVNALANVFPKQWFEGANFVAEKSQDALPKISGDFDMVYIDGDHTYDAVKRDWELVKDRWNRFCLFDDYHLPSKSEPAIECARMIDEIIDPSKELIFMDRRIFQDDRSVATLDYGQVLLTKTPTPRSSDPSYMDEWLK